MKTKKKMLIGYVNPDWKKSFRFKETELRIPHVASEVNNQSLRPKVKVRISIEHEIKTKICYKCKIRKPIEKFYQYKNGENKGNYNSWCGACNQEFVTPWKSVYQYIRTRCKQKSSYSYKRYKHLPFEITTAQIKKLWFRDKAWKLKRPSIDRIVDEKGYVMDNLHFIELSENSRKGALKGARLRRERKIVADGRKDKKFNT